MNIKLKRFLFSLVWVVNFSVAGNKEQAPQPASPYYRDLVHFALAKVGYKNPQTVNVVQAKTGDYLSGFSGYACNVTNTVMMDEKVLQQHKPYLAIINAFHEAAHMVKKHQLEQEKRKRSFNQKMQNTVCKKECIFALNRLSRVDEMEAELLAVQTLLQLQKRLNLDSELQKYFKELTPEQVVAERLASWKKCVDRAAGDITDGLHPTYGEFFTYVNSFVQAVKEGKYLSISHLVQKYKKECATKYVNSFNRCVAARIV